MTASSVIQRVSDAIGCSSVWLGRRHGAHDKHGHAKRIVALVLRDQGMSLHAIADVMGGRHHTTVLHYLQTATDADRMMALRLRRGASVDLAAEGVGL